MWNINNVSKITKELRVMEEKFIVITVIERDITVDTFNNENNAIEYMLEKYNNLKNTENDDYTETNSKSYALIRGFTDIDIIVKKI